MPNRFAAVASEAPSVRVLINLLEGISDPTVLLNGSLRIIFANAKARMRFSKVSFSLNDSFEGFLMAAFPKSGLSGLEETLDAALTAEDGKSSTYFLHEDQSQTFLRVAPISAVAGERPDNPLDVALAISFVDPDPSALPRLENVLDPSTDGVFIFNRENRIVYFNPACEKITGWRQGAAVMETYECSNVLKCHNEAGESMGSEALCPAKVFFHRDSVPVPREMLITTTGGKERWIETNYSPIKNARGDVEFIVGIMRDIDQRKRLETQLVQSRNLAMLGQLVSGIAHEIKNPLGIIMSSVEIMLDPSRPESERQEVASYIKDEVRRLDDRVKDFLAFARPKPIHAEEVNLNKLLGAVVLSYGSLRNPRLQIVPKLSRRKASVMGDPDQLHQVFLNLIINADQAMPDGGTLGISTQVLEDTVEVRFTDQGGGISEEDLPKIYDPFFTTKTDGTGLGLSIVHQILTAHRGKIAVSNNDGGRGVTFEIRIPAAEARA
ncbi:MAG: PAS domain-containing protein [Candidatus Sumerlaeaceae bacterium]|nr:PAS domain-containing protein [Candidatus Sumerlaeaceae bacterium]